MNNRAGLIAVSRTWAAGMVVFGGLALGAGSPAHAVSLLVNGGFETGTDPNVGTGGFRTILPGGTDIFGWTVSGGSVDYIGTYWQPGEGSRSIDLSGTGTTPPTGSLSQQFATTAGQKQLVSFLLAGNPDSGPNLKTAGLVVGVDLSIYTFDTTGLHKTNMGWTTDLVFVDRNDDRSLYHHFQQPNQYAIRPGTDGASVEAVPLPAALPLFASGLAGLGWLGRRRRKQLLTA